jgi:ABC-type sugar transport system ATPase subunit
LDQGQKLQAGTPMEVYRHPASIAAMELLADPGVNRFHRNGRLCALRPEHVAPTSAICSTTQCVDFQMQVTACDTNGDESFVHGLVEDREWVLRSRGMLPVTVGQTLSLSAATQDIVAF